jgi:hypothetical protein
MFMLLSDFIEEIEQLPISVVRSVRCECFVSRRIHYSPVAQSGGRPER